MPYHNTQQSEFQSTLSVRRATRSLILGLLVQLISIHALRKESDVEDCGGVTRYAISIHALRKESDLTQTRANTVD